MSSDKLGSMIERDVRQLIGDLNMQIIVLRNMLNLQQQPQPDQPKPPEPIPPQPDQPERPGPKEPGEKPDKRMNGARP